MSVAAIAPEAEDGPVFPGPPPGPDAALGMTLLADGHAEDARRLLSRAVADGDTAPATLLTLAIAADRTGNPEVARRAFTALEERYPEWDEPALRRAESLRNVAQHVASAQAYARVLELNPRRQDARLGLATLLMEQGDAAGAQPFIQDYVAAMPQRPDGWAVLGAALLAGGDAAAAERAFAEACRLAPAALDHALRRASAAQMAGLAQGELDRLEQVLLHDPLNVVAMTVRAVLLEQCGRRTEAIDLLQAASALAPDSHSLLATLGTYLGRADRLTESEIVLRQAVDLEPDDLPSRISLGGVLAAQHRHAEVIVEMQSVLAVDNTQIPALLNLALALVQVGRQEEGVQAARAVTLLEPNAVRGWKTLCHSLPYRDGVTGAELLAALRACSDLVPRRPPAPFLNTRSVDRRLRVGILSGTFYAHPVGWLTIAGFEALDREQFALVGVSSRLGKQDAMAARFRNAASEWHDVEAVEDDDALAETIRGLDIDILIDQGGYGEGSRMLVCTRRAAPVQVKWVGSQFHSSGLPEMDWIIADRWEIPPELEPHYTERPLRLDDGYVCFSPPVYAPDVGPLPALAQGHVTFGCFNNLAKITPRSIALWSTILHRVPKARMVLKSKQYADALTRTRIMACFAAHGIEEARLELRGSSDHRLFFEECNGIDIMLDPFPYCGGLTTCETLWMGVPTITLPGETFASRHSLSHLSNAGLADWAARDTGAYVALARRWSEDLAGLAALRAGLRARVKASPLCDAPRFGRSLGAALRHAWRDWCDRA